MAAIPPNRQYRIGDAIFGEYTISKVFGGQGKSGQGVVYLVTHRERTEPFVLKTLQATGDDQSRLKQFRQEAEVWVSLGQHPHIVEAYWVRELDWQLYVAAEYIQPDRAGRNTIADYIAQETLPDQLMGQWAVQFCDAMQYALGKGLKAHRDVKPANLMINPTGDLKVTDFGLARLAGTRSLALGAATLSSGPTPLAPAHSDRLAGTLPYMAPEQFFDIQNVDHRADIYAFGIVLFELATGGEYPYQVVENQLPPLQAYASTTT